MGRRRPGHCRRADVTNVDAVIWVIAGVAIIAIGLVVLVFNRRRTPDGVATFQRQIDALSPEARRPVVKRLEDVVNSDQDEAPDGRQKRDDGDVDGA